MGGEVYRNSVAWENSCGGPNVSAMSVELPSGYKKLSATVGVKDGQTLRANFEVYSDENGNGRAEPGEFLASVTAGNGSKTPFRIGLHNVHRLLLLIDVPQQGKCEPSVLVWGHAQLS